MTTPRDFRPAPRLLEGRPAGDWALLALLAAAGLTLLFWEQFWAALPF